MTRAPAHLISPAARALARRTLVLVLAALAGSGVVGAALAASDHVIDYLAGGSAYVNVGSADSVRAGDSLEVVRDGVSIAWLRVAFVSSHRAVCDTLSTRAPLVLGDPFRLPRRVLALATATAVAGAPADSSAPTAAAPAPPARSWSAARRMRGRVGARWLSVDTGGGRLQQPALDVRFDGQRIGDDRVDVALDLRTRHTTQSFADAADQSELLSRVYRASATVRVFGEHRRITVGRQNSTALSSISLFDGGLIEWGNDVRTLGVFGGSQPSPDGLKLSTQIVETGAYLEWHQRPLAAQRWSIVTGGVTSRDRGQPNRDFMFAQGAWSSPKLAASLAQEVDVNRGWKRDLGEPTLSPTSTFAYARAPVGRQVTLTARYDNRRNVRLYRDRLTPETLFDDAYRQGTWFGGEWSGFDALRLWGELRVDTGPDRSNTWSASGELYRLAPLHATLRARASRYSGDPLESRIASVSVGLDPLPRSHVETSGGVRSTTASTIPGEDRERWVSVDADISVGRRWYVNGGWEQDRGGSAGDVRQLQAGVSWRF